MRSPASLHGEELELVSLAEERVAKDSPASSSSLHGGDHTQQSNRRVIGGAVAMAVVSSCENLTCWTKKLPLPCLLSSAGLSQRAHRQCSGGSCAAVAGYDDDSKDGGSAVTAEVAVVSTHTKLKCQT